MNKMKSYFMFNKQERSGILFLVLLITGLLSVYYFVDFSKENILDISSPEISAIQKQIDSLRTLEIERRKPKSFPFNPNYITDFKGYTLGMNTEEIDRLKKYRDEGKWINSKSDFKRVTNVSDSLLKKISPYFKFPEWITNPESSKKSNFKNYSEKTFEQKTDLNKATVIQLQKVNGIGDVLSKRIITYRKKLGGYTSDIQLYNVYGLNPQTVSRTLNEFTVKTPKKINTMNLNTVSASDLATIPGISFELAKIIWEYRVLRGGINSFSELENIEKLSIRKLEGIQLYLHIE
ncbi:MAG: helix-hairpin-helix domain-containing protein [Bacteroidetes bacterium]|nr:helix-hairpin-helix domain-containing protein [Bacteroidota bacterium]